MRGRESNQTEEDIDSEIPDLSTNQLTEADISDINERIGHEYADADIDALEARNDELEEACYELSIELDRDGESASPDRRNEHATLIAEKDAIKRLLDERKRE
jgi:hypothetical protein